MNTSSNPRRALLLGLLVGLVAATGIGLAVVRERSSAATDIASENVRPRPTRTPSAVLTVPPERMRDAVENDSLLQPDRRFILAFEELSRLCGGAGKATLNASKRRWSVDAGFSRPAELPAIPSFQDALIELRAAAVNPRVPKGGTPLTEADATRLRALAADAFTDGPIRALEEVDRLWASGADRRLLLDLASLSYVTLLVQLSDSFEMADLVAGRALGLLALSEVVSGVHRQERARVLSDAMGYRPPGIIRRDGSRKVSVPQKLIPGDARRYGPTGSGADTCPDARYLDLLEKARSLSAAQMQDRLGALGYSNGAPGVHLLLRCREGDLGEKLELGSALVAVAFAEAGLSSVPRDSPVVPAFERALVSRPPTDGPFWDTGARDARLRALFYSGLVDIGDFYLDQLSSGPGATEFAQLLAGAEAGPGAQFRQLYDHLAKVKSGRMPAAGLVTDLDAVPGLGQAALRRLGDTLQSSLWATAPELPRVGARLAQLLDSRPENRLLFSRICHSALLDPLAARAYYLSASKPGVTANASDVWLAYTLGEVPRLEAIASDSTVAAWPRLLAVEYLEDFSALPDAELRRILQDVLASRPDDWSAMRSVRLLSEHGFLEDAERFLRSWLGSHPDAPALSKALYASRLEHVLFLEGRFDEAWSTIEPYIPTWKGDALGAGAEALQSLGRTDEALEMAGDCLERYPDDPMARTGLAKVLWRLGRHDAAAKPLVDPRHPLSSEDWRVLVAREFLEVFRSRPAEEAVPALEALLRAGASPWFLFEVASRFERAGKPDTSIVLLDAISRAKNEGIDGYLRAYRFRRRAHGEESADRWFREKVVTSRSASWVGATAFDEREFDLLWLLPDDENSWLLRVQAAAFQGRPGGPRLERLRVHFSDPSVPRFPAVVGRYLLGEAPDGDLLATATDAARRCEVAYLLGLKAAGEKRLEDASAWLRAAVRTGQTSTPAHKRASEMLKRWDVRRFGVVGGVEIR